MNSRAEPVACHATPGEQAADGISDPSAACLLCLPIAFGTLLFRPPQAFRRMGPGCRCRPAARCRLTSRTPAIPNRSRSRNQGVKSSPRRSAEVGSRPKVGAESRVAPEGRVDTADGDPVPYPPSTSAILHSTQPAPGVAPPITPGRGSGTRSRPCSPTSASCRTAPAGSASAELHRLGAHRPPLRAVLARRAGGGVSEQPGRHAGGAGEGGRSVRRPCDLGRVPGRETQAVTGAHAPDPARASGMALTLPPHDPRGMPVLLRHSYGIPAGFCCKFVRPD